MNAPPESTLAAIRSRGHWRIVVRPTRFQRDRVPSVTDLRSLIESMQVRIGGWYFPHLGDSIRIKGDCIEETAVAEAFLELFRLYQSGQFIHVSGFPEDWNERVRLFGKPDPRIKPGDRLGIGSVIYRMTHAYEFAARMAQRIPGDDDLRVEVTATGLLRRQLVVDAPHRARPLQEYRAEIPEFTDSLQLPRGSLIAKPRERALDFALKLFTQFQWLRMDRAVLRGWQSEMFPE